MVACRGYSWNKVVNVQHVAALGFTFRVLYDAWLVHRPHEPTASCTVCPKASKKQAEHAAALSSVSACAESPRVLP